MYKTRVNQPERVFLNSSDDPTNATTGSFNSFQIQLVTPLLGLKKLQLLRATIPNSPLNINIPAYSLIFWYYKLNSPTASPTPKDIRCVRILPENSISALQFAPYNVPVNTYLSSPADLVTLLNASASSNDDTILNPYFEQNDISFAYSVSSKKITMTGADPAYYYAPVGYNDPILKLIQSNNAQPQIAGPTGFFGTISQYPTVEQYPMQLRCGFALPGVTGIATLTGEAFQGGVPIAGDSYPNLVYSQCVYLYTNVAPGSSLGSAGQKTLLSVVPCNASPFGIIQYTVLMSNWLTKVASEIYDIRIEMLDDAQQPFILPDNAQVNLEIGCGYD